eukprot:2905919-Rhodomonas_salina.1
MVCLAPHHGRVCNAISRHSHTVCHTLITALQGHRRHQTLTGHLAPNDYTECITLFIAASPDLTTR